MSLEWVSVVMLVTSVISWSLGYFGGHHIGHLRGVLYELDRATFARNKKKHG